MKGYTLIELLTVILIIAILCSIAIIGGSALLTSSLLNEARDQFLSLVEDAKIRSATGHPHGINIASATEIQLIRLDDSGYCSATTTTACDCTSGCAHACPNGEICLFGDFRKQNAESVVVVSSSRLKSSIQVARNNACPDGEIWFDRKGLPRCSDWSLALSTIRFTKGTTFMDITLDRSGRVKYEH
jgi:prepilin-type N-terminal cleavage/methylation domain-containing protein